MRTLRATFGRATAVLRALPAGGWSGVNSQPPWCCWGVMFGIAAPEPHQGSGLRRRVGNAKKSVGF